MQIHAFDIFDVDIGSHWRRSPQGGWTPKDKARTILNEFDKPNRMIGSHTVIPELAKLIETAPADRDAGDPYGRAWRAEICEFLSSQPPDKRVLPEWFDRKFAALDYLNPKAIYEIVYPVRMVGGKPIYSPFFVQRVSLEFEHDHELTAAQVIHEEADRY